MMTKRALLALSGLVLVLAGCASDQQLLANDQTNAVQAAVRRGQFEMLLGALAVLWSFDRNDAFEHPASARALEWHRTCRIYGWRSGMRPEIHLRRCLPGGISQLPCGVRTKPGLHTVSYLLGRVVDRNLT